LDFYRAPGTGVTDWVDIYRIAHNTVAGANYGNVDMYMKLDSNSKCSLLPTVVVSGCASICEKPRWARMSDVKQIWGHTEIHVYHIMQQIYNIRPSNVRTLKLNLGHTRTQTHALTSRRRVRVLRFRPIA